MRHSYLVAASIALVSVVSGIGCGGGGSDATTTGSVKTQYLAQANAICRHGSSEIRKVSPHLLQKTEGQPDKVAAHQMVRVAIAPTFEQEIEELKTLHPPAAKSKELASVITGMERFIVQLEKDPTSFGSYPYRDIEDLAAGYGLSDCGHP